MRRAKELNLMLLLNGAGLNDPALVAQLQMRPGTLLKTLSALVVWPPGARNATATQRLIEQAFHLSTKRPPYFHPDLDQPERFADAVGESVIDDRGAQESTRRRVSSGRK